MAKTRSLVVLGLFLSVTLVAGTALALSFTDVTGVSGADDKGRGKGVAFADVDGDGDYDLYVSNKGGANKFYRNDSTPGNIVFTDITAAAGDNLGDVGFCIRHLPLPALVRQRPFRGSQQCRDDDRQEGVGVPEVARVVTEA